MYFFYLSNIKKKIHLIQKHSFLKKLTHLMKKIAFNEIYVVKWEKNKIEILKLIIMTIFI